MVGVMFAGPRLARVALAVCLCVVAWAVPLRAQAPPALTQPVNDFANVIDPDSRATLDRIIRSLERGTGDVIVVATIPTFRPAYADIREYAVKMFENGGRGIGDAEKDNGLLVLLSVDDRKVWIEVGYGLEGPVTDGISGSISRTDMVPFFRQGAYGKGLVAGVTRLAARVAEERGVTLADLPRLPARRDERRRTGLDARWILAIIVGLVVLNMIIGAMTPHALRGRRRGGWSSGGWSGWGGGGSFGGGSFGGGFGGFGGGGSGGGGGGASW